MWLRIHGVVLCLLLTACVQPEQPPRLYQATIERVRHLEGEYYTIEKGYGLQHEVTLRIQPEGTTLTLLLFDLYSPDVFGDERDVISFLYAGNRLPMNGRLWLDQLRGYRIERRVP